MSSFSTAGGGLKAATTLIGGRRSYYDEQGANLKTATGAALYSYVAGAARDAVNVTGSGVLEFAMFAGTTTSNINNRVIITIDGVVALDDSLAGLINRSGMVQVGNFFYITSTAITCTYSYVPFNKSLVINIESDDDATYYYNYYLT